MWAKLLLASLERSTTLLKLTWMKRLAKKLFENAMLGSRLALFVYAPFVHASSMDMLGTTLVLYSKFSAQL